MHRRATDISEAKRQKVIDLTVSASIAKIYLYCTVLYRVSELKTINLVQHYEFESLNVFPIVVHSRLMALY